MYTARRIQLCGQTMSSLPDGVPIEWKWDTGDETALFSSKEDEERQEEDQHSHTLTFKCMGTMKEDEYQDTSCFIWT